MRYLGLLEEDAFKVAPHMFRKYAETRGWQHIDWAKGDYHIYRRPGSTQYEVMVLNSTEYPSYGRRIIDSVLDVADFERRTPEEVLSELIELSSLSEAEYQEVDGSSTSGDIATSVQQEKTTNAPTNEYIPSSQNPAPEKQEGGQ